MGYPQYPPPGGTHYPPPNPPYGQLPPGSSPPRRTSIPGWVPALAVVGAVLLLGLASAVFGGADEEKSADQAPASASLMTVPVRAPQAAPFSERPSPAPAPPAAPVDSSPVTTEAAASAVMPAVVCMNLQDAQDLIQEAGVFYSRSTDATGAGRRQVLDRNWVVVGQTPAPGALIGEGDAVLSVVKIGESSRCR